MSLVSFLIVQQAARHCAMSTKAWNQNDNTAVPAVRIKMIELMALAILAFQPLIAQVVTADNCVHQAGDNPGWARKDFDDSQWSKQFPFIGSPYVWTRCRIDLSPLPRIAPLLIGVLNQDPWELFVNGAPAGSHGDIRTGFGTLSFEQRAIPSAAGAGPTMTLAPRQLPGRWPARLLSLVLDAGTKDSLALLSSNRTLSITALHLFRYPLELQHIRLCVQFFGHAVQDGGVFGVTLCFRPSGKVRKCRALQECRPVIVNPVNLFQQ